MSKASDEERRSKQREYQKAYRERHAEKNRERQREYRKKRYWADPDRGREEARKWREANPEKYAQTVKRSSLKRHYGLTPEKWSSMHEAQNFRCAICSDDNPEHWATDHCHRTGAVRSILCSSCNLGLGHFKDNPTILASAITYLGQHNGCGSGKLVHSG